MIITSVNVAERQKLDLRTGDMVRVHQRIVEKVEQKKADKKMEKKIRTRSQVFEGLVIAMKHGKEAGGTFTVRKVASGVGVEKIFPLFSPNITKIEVIARGKTRRSKLYYVRSKPAKEVSKKLRLSNLASVIEVDEEKLRAMEAEKIASMQDAPVAEVAPAEA